MMNQLKSKHKHTMPKSTGKYKSSHNDSKRRVVRRRKASDKLRAEIQATQPRVTMVLLPSGKRRFVREER